MGKYVSLRRVALVVQVGAELKADEHFDETFDELWEALGGLLPVARAQKKVRKLIRDRFFAQASQIARAHRLSRANRMLFVTFWTHKATNRYMDLAVPAWAERMTRTT